jgi:flagellar hook-basal body complex protein FliE
MSPLPPIGAAPVILPQGMFPTDEIGPLQATGVNAPGTFGTLVSQGLAHVNEQLRTSQGNLQRLATGDVQNLHQVMIQLEESRLSLQLMLQVRGRLLEAYQDVMKMQI